MKDKTINKKKSGQPNTRANDFSISPNHGT